MRKQSVGPARAEQTVIFKRWKVCGSCGERYAGTDKGTLLSGLVWFNCQWCDSTLAVEEREISNG